jgi:hypothetical protein
VSWSVVLHPEAEIERAKLPARERLALDNAVLKLQAVGPNLGSPHSSDVRAANGLRELRPRAGRSPYRGFYRRIGDVFVLAAVGPEAEVDRRGFERAAKAAEQRLDAIED